MVGRAHPGHAADEAVRQIPGRGDHHVALAVDISPLVVFIGKSRVSFGKIAHGLGASKSLFPKGRGLDRQNQQRQDDAEGFSHGLSTSFLFFIIARFFEESGNPNAPFLKRFGLPQV